jgi:hypothetical protein
MKKPIKEHTIVKMAFIKETDKAIYLRAPNGRPIWVPKSLIHQPVVGVVDGEVTEYHIEAWFVKKEGLN